MRKNRIEYLCFILILLILFVVYEKNMFLWAIVGLVLLSICTRVLIHIDSEKLRVSTKISHDDNNHAYLDVVVDMHKRLICTNQLQMGFVFSYVVFDKQEEKEVILYLTKKKNTYRIPIESTYCGQIQIEGKTCALLDVLRLFALPIQYRKISSTIIYPEKMSVQLGMSRNDKGMVDFDGWVQNRKGHDLSEIFDIRKYEPGDDVRSIHWKLSQKIDDLVIREASNLSQYSILLVPDLALEELDVDEMNGAVSLFIAISEELLNQRMGFCVPLVSEKDIQLCEISNLNQFHEVLDALLSLKAMPSHGELLKYMALNHIDLSFTRFIVVGNGKFKSDLYRANVERTFSLVHACKDVQKYYYTETQNYFDVYVPVCQKGKENYSLYF